MTQRDLRTGAPGTAGNPAEGLTKDLLVFGIVAGPLWEAVLWAQVLIRDGVNPLRHPASVLANGSLGWIQSANFVLAGAMIIAAAVGMRRALRSGRGRTWAPLLVGAYGAGLVCAGIFRADPAYGFPAGTPAGQGAGSWHSGLHYLFASLGFLALIVACFVLARRFTGLGQRGWAAFSVITGVCFLAANLTGLVIGSAHPAVFTTILDVAVALVWVWISAVSLHLYRRTASTPAP